MAQLSETKMGNLYSPIWKHLIPKKDNDNSPLIVAIIFKVFATADGNTQSPTTRD